MYVKRELIFISDGISDQAKDDQIEKTGENMIEDAEKSLFEPVNVKVVTPPEPTVKSGRAPTAAHAAPVQ